MSSSVARCALCVPFVAIALVLLVGCGSQAAATPAPTALATQAPTPTANIATASTAELSTPTPLALVGTATQLTGAALVEALRGGGYIIFLRHTATDMSVGDSDTLELADCTKQRNLNAQGRAEAQAIGTAMRALQIPISQVLTSRYCRTIDTARLAFGDAFIISDDITGFNLAPDSAERRRRNEALGGLLSTPPPAGSNLVLVSHQYNLGDVTGLESKEGDALVFAPTGPAGFTLVGRVAAGEWTALAR
jgi:phosphohistidine phosphatase SixA